MYKILHLATGTYVKYGRRNSDGVFSLVDIVFVSKDNAELAMTWEICVNYDKDIVMFKGTMNYHFGLINAQKVLPQHLELVGVGDD